MGTVVTSVRLAPRGSGAIGVYPPRRLHRVALIGNHLPRQCGIATFTTDLCHALHGVYPGTDCFVAAMNDAGHRHAYPALVRAQIDEQDADAYLRVADELNAAAVDVVSLQHEYGIYGGRAGRYILPLLRRLRMPVVTTLHTILAEPDAMQRGVMDEIVTRSERLVVMSRHGAELLEQVHHVAPQKIDVIPHGIPSVMFADGDKARIGAAGRHVILTFGLLSPDKGIEQMIDALPAILAEHPDTIYIVLGATHPHVLAHAGEAYRAMLQTRAEQLGVAGSMRFHNRFVSQAELADFVTAADIYVTPYLNPEQITSGTLAYAVGAGKAVISTPYRYAKELLAEGRGILVPWSDSRALANSVLGLLDDAPACAALRARAAAHGAAMSWPAVARQHMASLERAVADAAARRAAAVLLQRREVRSIALPALSLSHLIRMTDDTGLLQHARVTVPRYADGYCIDDNARALLLLTQLHDDPQSDPRVTEGLLSRYLAFTVHAFDEASGRFRNFLSYHRHWMEPHGSDDSHGRALWAVGALAGWSSRSALHGLARELFDAALPAMRTLHSPRAWAYALLGLDAYLRRCPDVEAAIEMRTLLAERLLAMYRHVASPEWPWFEDRVTYCNARLSEALLVSGIAMGRNDMQRAGLDSLRWLSAVQHTPDGIFAPIGSNGFYVQGAPAARFDQQPVEACGMVAACLRAFRCTGELRWQGRAESAFSWFTGRNQLGRSLYDPQSGGCRDGLHEDRMNENQGAESTLSFLLALVDMRTLGAADLRRAVEA